MGTYIPQHVSNNGQTQRTSDNGAFNLVIQRKLVNETKINTNKTWKHDLNCEHLCPLAKWIGPQDNLCLLAILHSLISRKRTLKFWSTLSEFCTPQVLPFFTVSSMFCLHEVQYIFPPASVSIRQYMNMNRHNGGHLCKALQSDWSTNPLFNVSPPPAAEVV